MTVGIIGLGLIGGSLAKAYRRDPSVTVLGWDTDRSITEFAQIAQAIHAPLTEERLGELDLLLLATYPEAVVEHMERLAPKIQPHTMVIDCAGTKEKVCQKVFPLAEQYGFPFLGGHPMAGTHFSGFKYSRADLFDGAPMVLVPPTFDDIRLLDRAKKLLEPVGFGRVSITTADRHDLPDGPCDLQRLHQKPHRPGARRLLRRQLQGPDPGGLAQPLHVGRAFFGKPGQHALRAGHPHRRPGPVPQGHPGKRF